MSHPQNVFWCGSPTQTSQTLRSPSPVLLTTSRCSEAPLELRTVLSDSARASSCAPESTGSDGGAFRMLQELTIRIVKFWSCWDLCAGLQETSRAAETSARVCRRHHQQLRRLRRLFGRLGTIFSPQWIIEFRNHKALCSLYPSLLKSQDSLHPTMACIILVSLYISIGRWTQREGVNIWQTPG